MKIQQTAQFVLDFYKKNGYNISNLHSWIISKSLISIRYLSDQFINYPQYILKQLVKQSGNLDIVYIPCDMIELKYLLKTKNESLEYQKCYYSLEFAQKHFLDNAIIIGYEVQTNNYGQLLIQKSECQPKIKRIIIRDEFLNPSLQQSIISAVKQTEQNIQIMYSSSVVSIREQSKQSYSWPNNISMPKHASKEKDGLNHLDKNVKSKFFMGARVSLNKDGGISHDNMSGYIMLMDKDNITVKWESGKFKGKSSKYSIQDSVSLARLNIIGVK